MKITKSDNKAPQHRMGEIITPEVYGSQFTDSIYGTTFDRMLSKDDGERIAGFIGTPNPKAYVNRQVVEDNAFRQEYQLQPITVAKKGSDTSILTYEHYLEKLSIMGVDIDRIDEWANLDSFNFVPPVNFDMMINYSDYYWDGPEDSVPQYITIENRCHKLNTKLTTYNRLLESVGSQFNVIASDIPNSTLTVDGALDSVFVEDFTIYTTSSNAPLNDKYWTVLSSRFNETRGTTTIQLEPMCFISDIPPFMPKMDEMWYSETTRLLQYWDGDQWLLMTDQVNLDVRISLQVIVESMEFERNCTCYGDVGWDKSQWDDNQSGSVLWNKELIEQIAHDTEGEWEIANPGNKNAQSLWYDTMRDHLKLWSVIDGEWKTINHTFSLTLNKTIGLHGYDKTEGCDVQVLNDWSTDNHWKHKSDLVSFGGLVRANIPIIEYSSDIEMNAWLRITRQWRYRGLPAHSFDRVELSPQLFELQPITSFIVGITGNEWAMYLYNPDNSYIRDMDYTETFVPGYDYLMIDDNNVRHPYRVARSEYRTLTSDDSAKAFNKIGNDVSVTVIYLENAIYYGPEEPTVLRERLIPTKTSRGDIWLGYQEHWVLEENFIEYSPTAKPVSNFYETYPTFTEIERIPNKGFQTITNTYQEILLTDNGVQTIQLDPRLMPALGSSNFFATEDNVKVFLNGALLEDTEYTLTFGSFQDYIAIGDDLINSSTRYVTSVTYIDPVYQRDVLRVSVAAQSQADSGLFNIPVRTITDDVEFVDAVTLGNQPMRVTMNVYEQYIQKKTYSNQYPLFNVYDVVSNEVVRADQLFQYAIHESMPINNDVGRRILATPDGREFGFEQLLTAESGEMWAYRETYNMPIDAIWYNSADRKVLTWLDGSWSEEFVVFNSMGTREVIVPIVSTDAPRISTGMILWYNPETAELQFYDGLNNDWELFGLNPIIGQSDPMLYTIWRTGPLPVRYQPNKKQVKMADGTIDVIWEMIDPWFFNMSHENRNIVRLSQLTSHMKDVMEKQSAVPGLAGGGSFTLNQRQFNYGYGGKIKEYNDSMDLLVSALRVQNGLPTNIIEFAKDQYGYLLSYVAETMTNRAGHLYSDTSAESMINVIPSVTRRMEEFITENSFLDSMYRDSSSFNPDTKVGVRNWIATLPINRMVEPVRPYYTRVDNMFHFVHHDGHRSIINVTNEEVEVTVRNICNELDARRSGEHTMGRMSNVNPPATEDAFIDVFNNLYNGIYWYNSVTDKLYRFSPFSITGSPPSTRLPEGTLFYNNAIHSSYILESGRWTQLTVDGDITPLWLEVDIRQVIADVYYDFEFQLYMRSLEIKNSRNLLMDDLQVTSSDKSLHEEMMESSYVEYAALISGSERSPFTNSEYRMNDAFTWNYMDSVIITAPSNKPVEYPLQSDWRSLYETLYNTPYPHLEPWMLQGYDDKPLWWDAEYLDDTNNRRWKYDPVADVGMWKNIRDGIIPHGRMMPNGTISRPGEELIDVVYQYVSVNTSNVAVNGIGTDEVFPPYLSLQGVPNSTVNRSVFSSFGTDVIAPSVDYRFGSGSALEWQWRNSLAYEYDVIINWFKVQPIRTMRALYGPNYTTVGHLQVDTTQKLVLSHSRNILHGDIYNNSVFTTIGMNQWYVNHTRFANADINKDFRKDWSDWEVKLSYLTDRTIDTNQLNVRHKYFDITDRDQEVLFANTGIEDTKKVDAFRITILSTPPRLISADTERDWRFEVTTNSKKTEVIKGYAAIQMMGSLNDNGVDIDADVALITDLDVNAKRITVLGNYQHILSANDHVEFNGARNLVVRTAYYPETNDTRITLLDRIDDLDVGDLIRLQTSGSLIQTGDLLNITTTTGPIIPLTKNTRYYAIKTDTGIRLAESANDAHNGIAISGLTTVHDNIIEMRVIEATFRLFGGQISTDIWNHHAIDRSKVIEYVFPTRMQGIQSLLDAMRGIQYYYTDNDGINFETGDVLDIDPELGRTEGWQLETERFLTWATTTQLQQRNTVINNYPVRLDVLDDTLLRIEVGKPQWVNGERIMFIAVSGTNMPLPIIAGNAYYYFEGDQPDTFRIATDINGHNVVRITGMAPQGLSVSKYTTSNVPLVAYEFNPFRYNIQVDTPKGIVSNAFVGPYSEASAREQTIFDQFGNRLSENDILLYRQDESTIVSLTGGRDVPNYIGGLRLYIEGYEHILILNHYTLNHALIYDPFVGLRVDKLDIEFYRKKSATKRPTLGGFALSDKKFHRNIEGSVEDLRRMYDPYAIHQNSALDVGAKQLLGFRPLHYMRDHIGTYEMSQFIFYRGMIRAKGSNKSIDAFTNSRYFIDANIDEFWARKIGDFGDLRPDLKPEIKLTSSDSSVDDVRFLFRDGIDAYTTLDEDGNTVNVLSFDGDSNERWVNLPNQREYLHDDSKVFKTRVNKLMRIYKVANANMAWKDAIIDELLNVDYVFDNAKNLVYPVKQGTMLDAIDWSVVSRHVLIPINCADIIFAVVHNKNGQEIGGNASRLIDNSPDPAEWNNIGLELLNADALRWNVAKVANGNTLSVYVRGINAASNSPSYIMDAVDHTTIATMPLWDPARGVHSSKANFNIDIKSDADPARYNTTMAESRTSDDSWNDQEVGQMWLDTGVLSYAPYYDPTRMQDLNESLYKWGRLADWSSVDVYQWVESTAEPDVWEAQSLNKPSMGTPRKGTYYRTRFVDEVNIALNSPNITATPEFLAQNLYVGMRVTLYCSGIYPTYREGDIDGRLDSDTKYYIESISPLRISLFSPDNQDTPTYMSFTTINVLPMIMAPEFDPNGWKEDVELTESFYMGMYPSLLGNKTTIDIAVEHIGDGETVNVYINGTEAELSPYVIKHGKLTLENTNFSKRDVVTIIKRIHELTEGEKNFDSESEDDATVTVEWKYDYEYTRLYDGDDTRYYFWVKDRLVRETGTDKLAPLEVAAQYENIPGPYIVATKPVNSAMQTPYYEYVIIRGIHGIITEDDRYTWRVTYNDTLRDVVGNNKKPKHEQWFMFREGQVERIDSKLWDKLIECIIGEELLTGIRVPSLDREEYDDKYGSVTRYGFGNGQAMTDGKYAMNSILNYLNNSDNDFYPLDLNVFTSKFDIGTNQGIVDMLQEMYKTFPVNHVNSIWFEVLNDALVTQPNYQDLMKTSWIAVTGIRLLNVDGMLDD